jgi:hypothetical protein
MYDLREFFKSIEGTCYSFTIRILDSDRKQCNFHTKLLFPMLTNYRCRFRSYRFRSRFREKYENKNGFNVYRSFATVFTPTSDKFFF